MGGPGAHGGGPNVTPILRAGLDQEWFYFIIRRVLMTARPETTIFSVRSLISSPPVKLPTGREVRCQPD
jgi:hypothetical protein